MKIRCGSAVVSSIYERDLDEISFLIPEAEPAALATIPWLQPHYVDDTGQPRGVVQAFVIELDRKVILVDCCVGDDKDITVVEAWAHSRSGFLERFTSAGFDPNHVDIVLCTHLHVDHVGWNTTWTGDGWTPTFPNARHIVVRNELEYWQKTNTTPAPQPKEQPDIVEHVLAQFHQTQVKVYEQSVQPIIDAGLIDLVDAPTEVIPGVSLTPTPGHTPGHSSIWLRSAGENVFISGDSFHHPCQIANPKWAARSDDDQDLSTETRRRLLAELNNSSTTFVGTHFAAPCHGSIVSTDGSDGYRFEPRVSVE